MLRSGPEVAVDRLRCAVAEARRANAPTLPEDADHARVEVDVGAVVSVQSEAGELGQSNPGVGEQTDDRRVASVLEVVSCGALEDRLNVGGR
jgi:hypothetical protein